MPAGMGEEDRFAAWVEYGTTPASTGGVDDGADDLERELEIVAMLRSGAPALGPDPAARARAKQRLMAAFAQEFADGSGTTTGPVQVVGPVAVASRTSVRLAEPTPLRRTTVDGGPVDGSTGDGSTVDAGPTGGSTVGGSAPTRRAGRHSAPEPVADETATTAGGGNVRPLRASRRNAATPRTGNRRAALLGAAAAAALVALAGTGTFASQDALPGDTMYGVKRVAESTGLALTFGEQAKARRHLEQAQRRLDEVQGMVARDRAAAAGAPAAASDPELVQSTMQEFDADASEGSRLLLAGAAPDTAEVDEIRNWAAEQSARLSEMRATLPAPARADESLALLDRLLGETAALQNDLCPPAGTAPGASEDEGDGPAPETAAGTPEVCAPLTAPESAPGVTGTEVAPVPDDTDTAPAPGGTSDDEGSDDGDDERGDEGRGADDRSGADDDRSRGTTVRGSSSTTTAPADGSGGGSDDDDLSVPLPVPGSIDLPPALPGVPGISLGGN